VPSEHRHEPRLELREIHEMIVPLQAGQETIEPWGMRPLP
jgi:hypothetical protein